MRLRQFLEVKHRAKVRFDLVDGFSTSRAGMARDDDHTRLIDALCELTNRLRIQLILYQAHGMRCEDAAGKRTHNTCSNPEVGKRK